MAAERAGYSSCARTWHHLLGDLWSSRLLPRQAAPRQGPFGHTDPSRRQRITYPSVPCFLSGTQTLPCCRTAGKCEAGPYMQVAHRLLEPQQVCRSAMANRSEGSVKLHSNSLCCRNSSFPPQLALLSATGDPVLKGTGKGKMFPRRRSEHCYSSQSHPKQGGGGK